MNSAPRVAIVLFPGMNCENETARSLASVGVFAEILRSNTPASRLDGFDGYIVPGGFSYEDRIRAGAVAARHPTMGVLARAAEAGKPIAGICNGAQALLEAGLVPGLVPGTIEMALALNDSGRHVGYLTGWRYLVGSLFAEPAPLPFAHGEGRFVSNDPRVLEKCLSQDLVAARYCDEAGRVAAGWPTNPNGAWQSTAALRSAGGNVIAIMPHPERANWLWQVPHDVGGVWAEQKRELSRLGANAWREAPGPGRIFFQDFAALLQRALA